MPHRSASSSLFAALGVPEDIVSQLATAGITIPSPIQHAALPDALAGRDVAGRAPTGSGKTLAFGIPLAVNLAPARAKRPSALVLAPTRELAQQIADVLAPIVKLRGGSVAAIFGGVGYGPQRSALAAGANVVVACPGRLEDLLSMGAVSLGDVRQVVIDEADRMADMGFLPAVKRIVAQAHADRQTMLFSATFDGATGKALAGFQRSPVRHDVDPGDDKVTAAHHVFWRMERTERTDWLAKVVATAGSTMVFCRTRHGADRVARQLNRAGVTAAAIHGGRSQPQRDRALAAFVDGSVSALVATDVAARGVHVDEVAAVVHYDPPADGATYVHRSGRTARAGAGGVVVSLVEPAVEADIPGIQRGAGITGPITAPRLDHLAAAPTPAPESAAATPAPTVPEARHQQRAAAAASKRSKVRPLHQTSAGNRRGGTIRYFHRNRGFGFIAADHGPDVFVHHSNAPRTIGRGQRVEYRVRESERGLEAIDVVIL